MQTDSACFYAAITCDNEIWSTEVIRKMIGSRVGLLGNPSDGFGGKTIAAMVEDFWAVVTIRESEEVRILPHPELDPFAFATFDELAQVAERDGYYGGTRLLYAACKRFHDYCRQHDILLRDRGFTIKYDTNIPRQVGLAGSSAIVTAAIQGLMQFYGLSDDDIPKALQPHLVLSVEIQELGIQAGLQDRVVQVYGGAVYMDFDPAYMAEHGHGSYEPLALDLLPPMYVAWNPHVTTTSGKAHNPMRFRYEKGDPEVIRGMTQLAAFADEGYTALKQGDFGTFGELMNQNFDLRQRLYGDDAINGHNLQMIEIARSHGLPAKFPGSGGAIVGIYDDPERGRRAGEVFQEAGYGFSLVKPTPGIDLEDLPCAEVSD